jgi:hypothetical protein
MRTARLRSSKSASVVAVSAGSEGGTNRSWTPSISSSARNNSRWGSVTAACSRKSRRENDSRRSCESTKARTASSQRSGKVKPDRARSSRARSHHTTGLAARSSYLATSTGLPSMCRSAWRRYLSQSANRYGDPLTIAPMISIGRNDLARVSKHQNDRRLDRKRTYPKRKREAVPRIFEDPRRRREDSSEELGRLGVERVQPRVARRRRPCAKRLLAPVASR